MAARLDWLEIRGFRAFGSEVRRLDLTSSLIVVHAGNSQGKTSLAEAVEFLVTGRSSRRDLFGGAKAEYNASLRNAHLPADAAVWVAAGLRGDDGALHTARRDLVADFNGATDSSSQLTIDGVATDSLAVLGISANEGAIAAPVLLQHTLRYVLSTEPKQRASYFKALLTLTDLDLFRDRVHRQLTELQRAAAGPAHLAVERLSRAGHAEVATALQGLGGSAPEMSSAAAAALLAAGNAVLPVATASIEDLVAALEDAVRTGDDRTFPLTELAPKALPAMPIRPDLQPYRAAMVEAADTVTALLPVFAAVLAVPDLQHLEHAADCPVCASPAALTPERILELRSQVLAGADLTTVADSTSEALRTARDQIRIGLRHVHDSVPKAAQWSDAQRADLQNRAATLLGDDAPEFQTAVTYAHELSSRADRVAEVGEKVAQTLDEALEAIARRSDPETLPPLGWDELEREVEAFRELAAAPAALKELRARMQPVLHDLRQHDGLDQLLLVVRQVHEFVEEQQELHRRDGVIRRLTRAEKTIKQAMGAVLDDRFASMSGAIERWWATIRPHELVGFAGVKRRAAGAIFVNLVAALQPQERAEPVERDALGVYSDSQLNALGLSTFLARMQLIDSPFVFLDDPIPGSDGDHRLTFVQNTLAELLDDGRQVVLTTYDPKLADWAQTTHDAREPISYELNLLDMVEGTEPVQTSDAFSRYMLQGEDGLSAPTAEGRRGACAAYRSAAERLAKQIIATNRTHSGTPTTVADVEREAKMLNELIKLVTPFTLSEDEKGKWRVLPKVLNPGNHDDDVPSTIELRQVRGNLRAFAKAHKARWGGSLLG